MAQPVLDPHVSFRGNPGDRERLASLLPVMQQQAAGVRLSVSDVAREALKRGLASLVTEYVRGEEAG